MQRLQGRQRTAHEAVLCGQAPDTGWCRPSRNAHHRLEPAVSSSGGGPAAPAGYSSIGTASCAHACRTGSMIRQACSASSPLTERSEEHTSELQSRQYLVCRLLLEKKKTIEQIHPNHTSTHATLSYVD